MKTKELISPHLIEQAKAVNLITLVGSAVELSQASGVREMQGPCPKCGGDDRLHVKLDSFFCRQCHPEWGDPIDYIRWLDGCDFTEAVTKLTGSPQRGHSGGATQRCTPKPVERRQQAATWANEAVAIAKEAHAELIKQVGLGEGGEYLLKRGIDVPAWHAFGLGFRPDVPLPGTWDKEARRHVTEPQPAIVMPWYRGGRLTAIRYRFIKDHTYADAKGHQRQAKQTAQYDSDFGGYLYGGQTILGCAEIYRTLVLCEGELNAISIWQTTHAWNWDVLSLGSESAKLSDSAIEYAGQYERVLIWMDRPEVAMALMGRILGAYGLHSPAFGDAKHDANAMLQSGRLGAYLATIRYGACTSATERKRLMWDLHDAQSDLDDRTKEVLDMIKQKEG